ncbi:XAC2610-related protein [Aureispira anguillae]|uniref:Lipoprotein n=1 Tax=Aureispira anguillae TaxID=2864201 RepID=A0A916DSS9_9BACT|nr:hypothetical protein [Aureispira anguillae]BDS11350.1 hypothetical protein AsAng_0020620 [Aureispira anguillae]
MTTRISFCLWIPLLFLLMTCNTETKEANVTEIKEVVEQPEKNMEEEKPEKLEFEGKNIINTDQEIITAIEIRKKGTTEIFQIIKGLELPYQDGNPFFEQPTFEDLNFDGIPDMRMPEAMGNVNVYYAYWIYNSKNQQFERNTEMNLSLPTVDPQKQEIKSSERGSAATYTETIYGVQDGKFIKKSIENRTYSSESTYQSVVQERQEDGSMKEIRNEEVTE